MSWTLNRSSADELLLSFSGGLSRLESHDAAAAVARELSAAPAALVLDSSELTDYDDAACEAWQMRLFPVRRNLRKLVFRGGGALSRWDAMLVAVYLRIPYEFQYGDESPIAVNG